MNKKIGFVATRFKGTDGVTLEAGKWADVLERIGLSSTIIPNFLDFENPPSNCPGVMEDLRETLSGIPFMDEVK